MIELIELIFFSIICFIIGFGLGYIKTQKHKQNKKNDLTFLYKDKKKDKILDKM